jgi:hypothetical protein
MWPMPALAHKFVSIIFIPDVVICYWLEKTEKNKQLVVRAYKQYPLGNLELTNLILFNPTVIKKHITSFLSEHNLQDAFVAFALHGPAVHEEFVTLPTSTPHRNDFTIPNSSHLLWEYRYVYPSDDGQFVFYVYSVPRFVVLQYELLAVAAQCNLITMTTQTMALLSAYEHMFGSAFRRSQLAIDMMQCNNNIGDLITADAVKCMVIGLPAEASAKEGATAVGLFCSEKV